MKSIWALQAVIILVLIVWLPTVGANNDSDTQAPTISKVRVLVIAETWFTIEWETDEPALGGVEWGLDRNYGNIAYGSGNYTQKYFVNVTGLSRATNYHFRVFAEDPRNNTGYSSDQELGTYPLGRGSSGSLDILWIIAAVAIGTLILIAVIFIVFRAGRKT